MIKHGSLFYVETAKVQRLTGSLRAILLGAAGPEKDLSRHSIASSALS